MREGFLPTLAALPRAVTLETPEIMRVLRFVGVFLAARPLGSVSWRMAVSATGSRPLARWLSPAGHRVDPTLLQLPLDQNPQAPPKMALTLGPQYQLTLPCSRSPLTAAAVGGAAGATALTQHRRLLRHLYLGRGAGGGVCWAGEGQ